MIGIIGRRGGKSRAVAVLAAYLGTLIDYRDVLVVGERGLPQAWIGTYGTGGRVEYLAKNNPHMPQPRARDTIRVIQVKRPTSRRKAFGYTNEQTEELK